MRRIVAATAAANYREGQCKQGCQEDLPEPLREFVASGEFYAAQKLFKAFGISVILYGFHQTPIGLSFGPDGWVAQGHTHGLYVNKCVSHTEVVSMCKEVGTSLKKLIEELRGEIDGTADYILKG